MNKMFVKSTHFKQVCQLLLSLIVALNVNISFHSVKSLVFKQGSNNFPVNKAKWST